jgi:23S rRNA pseudouridine1911/1915/1917 synthase
VSRLSEASQRQDIPPLAPGPTGSEDLEMPLFENDEIIAIDKPAGVSMATSSRAGKSAQDVVQRLLEACGERKDRELFLLHRLDVGTSGVVLLAKTPQGHRVLSRTLQGGGARKTYRALVWGRPRPPEGVIELPLGRDPRDGRKMKVRSDGKRAVTRYQTLARLRSVTDLALFPQTGRTHQIRVHLSARGHPIVGDDLYGGATRWRGVRDPVSRKALSSVTRPLLHAERIELPALGIDVSASLPEDFQSLLALLGTDTR